jgi:hypothetical protein
MQLITLVGLVVFVGLSIVGRRLREQAFRALPVEHRVKVIDKVANYSPAETIPFAALVLAYAALVLALAGLGLLRLESLKLTFTVFGVLFMSLVGILHFRTRHRFHKLGLPAAFLSRYEHSRVVSYSALAILVATAVWVLDL